MVNLEIISHPDLQPAFQKRTDLSLAAQAGNISAEPRISKIEKETAAGRTDEETDPYKDEIIL